MVMESAQAGFVPFMLALKGHQMKTVELSLLRFDGTQNLFLSKPDSAPPVEQKWRVAPLRWSAEREPFVILTHRETNRLRLVVAKPDCACELWPVMYSSDRPDGGIDNCPVSPARCKLVPFMFQGGLYVLASERPSGQTAVLQINSPTEPWVCVSDNITSFSSAAKVTPFYMGEQTFFVVQQSNGSDPSVSVHQVIGGDAFISDPLSTKGIVPLGLSRIQFVYCKLPPVVAASQGTQLGVFGTWIDGCMLYLAELAHGDDILSWKLLNAVPVPPHSRIGTVYVPFLSEPLLVTTSMDPHYVGSVAVRRLFLTEHVLANQGLIDSDLAEIPRVIRYMQVPAMPVSMRDLTADLPITDLPYRDFIGDFVGKKLPYDLSVMSSGLPPPPKAPSHGPIPLLLGSRLMCLQDKTRLDLIPGPEPGEADDWRITPLRWAPPGREVLFVILQSVSRRITRIAIASPESADCDTWPVQIEFPDASIPFSECDLTPFQYQTVPGASDLFVVANHTVSGKGALFFVPNPKGEWQFIREETELRDIRSVMYHRSKDPTSVNVCTLFVLASGAVRVLVEPNQPTFEVFNLGHKLDGEVHVLYAFAPKPPVTHVWPCEVFVVYTIHNGSELRIVHVPRADGEWRLLCEQPLPPLAPPGKGDRISPVYLPYLAEPLVLVRCAGPVFDLLRLNLIESVSSADARPRFVQRYHIETVEDSEETFFTDVSLDAPLVWIPQMGLQGMHPYSGYPLPFEKE